MGVLYLQAAEYEASQSSGPVYCPPLHLKHGGLPPTLPHPGPLGPLPHASAHSSNSLSNIFLQIKQLRNYKRFGRYCPRDCIVIISINSSLAIVCIVANRTVHSDLYSIKD